MLWLRCCLICVWSSEVIADGRKQLSDNQRTASEEGSGKRRQRTALQVMLEARDDDGNPVGFSPYSLPIFMHENCSLCLYNVPCVCTMRLHYVYGSMSHCVLSLLAQPHNQLGIDRAGASSPTSFICYITICGVEPFVTHHTSWLGKHRQM